MIEKYANFHFETMTFKEVSLLYQKFSEFGRTNLERKKKKLKTSTQPDDGNYLRMRSTSVVLSGCVIIFIVFSSQRNCFQLKLFLASVYE